MPHVFHPMSSLPLPPFHAMYIPSRTFLPPLHVLFQIMISVPFVFPADAMIEIFYGWIKFHYVYIPFLFIVDECLGWFYLIATVNNIAVNMHVQVSLWCTDVKWVSRVVYLDSLFHLLFLLVCGFCLFVFWSTSTLTPTVTPQIYILRSSKSKAPLSPHSPCCLGGRWEGIWMVSIHVP